MTIKKYLTVVLTVLFAAPAAFSQLPLTANTVKLEDGQTGQKATIRDMRRLAGTWHGTGLGGFVEEIYSAPRDGVMMGVFRFLEKEKTVFYETILVLEENGTLAVRLKHFNADFTGWEEKDKNVLFRFVKKGANRMYFEGQTFEFVGRNRLNIYVAINQKDGTMREEVFRYTRR